MAELGLAAHRRAKATAENGLVVTQTPLRISFAGGGTDLPAFYEMDTGAVFSTTIDKYVYVTVKRHGPVFDENIRLNYSVSEAVASVDAIRNDIARECLKLLEIDGSIYISVVSDLPDSSGLGGSSSFAVGLLNALHTFRGDRVTAAQLADEACHVEIDILGEPIGRQDQYAAAFGGLNLFTFRANGDVVVQPQRSFNGAADELFRRLVMLWTGHQRRASLVLREQRSRTAEHRDQLVQMRQLAFELQTVMADEQPDFGRFGEILHENWKLKRGLASQMSSDQIDAWYGRAMEAGALGGKLCGAGAGGFLLFLAAPETIPQVKGALCDMAAVDIGYEAHGTRVLLSKGGAHAIPTGSAAARSTL